MTGRKQSERYGCRVIPADFPPASPLRFDSTLSSSARALVPSLALEMPSESAGGTQVSVSRRFPNC